MFFTWYFLRFDGIQHIRCADHFHADGKFRYSLCQVCNGLIGNRFEVPFIAHNSAGTWILCEFHAVMMLIFNYILWVILLLDVLGFDSHLLLEFLSSNTNEIRSIDHVLAKTIEKFISFRVRFRSVWFERLFMLITYLWLC